MPQPPLLDRRKLSAARGSAALRRARGCRSPVTAASEVHHVAGPCRSQGVSRGHGPQRARRRGHASSPQMSWTPAERRRSRWSLHAGRLAWAALTRGKMIIGMVATDSHRTVRAVVSNAQGQFGNAIRTLDQSFAQVWTPPALAATTRSWPRRWSGRSWCASSLWSRPERAAACAAASRMAVARLRSCSRAGHGVLVSQQGSCKTLGQHQAGRATVVREGAPRCPGHKG